MELILQKDMEIVLWIQENLRTPPLTAFLRTVTHLGDLGAVWIVLCVALLIFVKTRRSGICASVSLASAFFINDVILKNIFERLRPFEAAETVRELIDHPGGASFPSGHTAAAFAAAMALVFSRAPRYISIPALVLAALIAFSRLYLGVHYLTDIIIGAAVGTAVAAAAVAAVKRLKKD